jgi:hypothetical protein
MDLAPALASLKFLGLNKEVDEGRNNIVSMKFGSVMVDVLNYKQKLLITGNFSIISICIV